MEPKNATALIFDHGLFCSWGIRLAREFKTVKYYVPWGGLFPDMRHALVGDGFDEIERVQDFWAEVKDADIIIFPDVYSADELNHCRYELGKRCWGAGNGEELELNRWDAKQLLEKKGLPSSPAKRIIGIDDLRAELKKSEDKYVKISRYRGVGETFYHRTYKLSEQWIDEKEHHLGKQKYMMPFMVEDKIDSKCEPGWDGYTIDGQYPKESIIGFEVKDKGYVCSVMPSEQMSEGLTAITKALAPEFKKYEYRGWFSAEAFAADGKVYPIDLTCRSASPAGETYQELIKNWGDILWAGSEGEFVEPEYEAKFGAQIIMKAEWVENNWLPIYYPTRLNRWVKLYNACRIEDQVCVIPQEDVKLSAVGSIVAIGDSLAQAVRTLKRYAEQVEGYSLDTDCDPVNEAVEMANKAEKEGVRFYP